MQLHHQIRNAWLEAADRLDATAAAIARARIHSQADLSRLLRGRAPLHRHRRPASAHEVVAEGPVARLLRFGAIGPRRGSPVLVVFSLINRYYVLDLLPEVSAIDVLRRRGLDVWVLDWKAPGARGPDLGFADYVDQAIPWAADQALAGGGGERVSLLGYCMGGTMAAMAAARHPERFGALALLATPIDFRASGVLARLTARGLFDADLLMALHGNMPAALMQLGLHLTRPWEAPGKLLRMLLADDELELRHRVAVEVWLEDQLAFPGGVYREYIGRLYQDNALARGRMTVAGTAVDLGRITAPLLVVTGERDHICAPPSSHALLPLCGSRDRRLLEFPTGHIGMAVSRRSIAGLWPEVADWFVDRA